MKDIKQQACLLFLFIYGQKIKLIFKIKFITGENSFYM